MKQVNKLIGSHSLFIIQSYDFPEYQTKNFWRVKRVSLIAYKADSIELLD